MFLSFFGQMGLEKRNLENLKFGPISHITLARQNHVIATLAPPTSAKRPYSLIYFSVKNIKIGQEMAKWWGF